jgi:2-polyprenyl-6-methoxyphenol hydroxylase-like FAD-dependent oxidoreductase
MVAYEQDTWMLSVARHGDYGSPPADFTAMLAAAKQILPPAVMAAVREATPVGDIAVSRDTGALWHRYDRMPRFPAGLVVIGDGLCRLNPLHGQGMTMAALEALALRDCLRQHGPDLPHRFFRAAADQIAPIWAMNAAHDSPSDRRHPVRHRLNRWFADAAATAASRDIAVTERFLRVRNLLDPPSRLRDPVLLWRILRANLPAARKTARRARARTQLAALAPVPTAGGSHA